VSHGRIAIAEHQVPTLFVEHRSAEWSYRYRRLDPNDIPGAVEDVFLVAWRGLDDVPPGAEKRLWRYGVVKNVVRSIERSARRQTRVRWKLAA
jgi:DNA-directed RNA polymerase specialized sigma24 family protein